jgi:NADPH:quinone reductase-like Zn-dependent oxidoreductase
MKAVRHHSYGDTSVLRYEEAPRPVPGAGQVLVRVVATTFNPVDAAIRAGYLQQVFPLRFPHIPGLDVAGTVEQTGDGVTGLGVGDPVIGFLPMGEDGAAADFVLAPADVLVAAPQSIPLAQAAALPTVGLTAWQALFEHADLTSGQRILINGAGGAVGGYAVQLAHQAGAFVIATATPRSADAARRHGADQVVDHTATSVTEEVVDPVDVVLNLAPMPDPGAVLGLVRPGGVLVTTVPPAPEPGVDGVRSVALMVRSDREQLAALVERVDSGQLTVDVGQTLQLSELASVHASSEAGGLRGKVLLTT